MKRVFVQWFVRQTEKYVWALANAYGLKVNRSGIAFGQHPLIFQGGEYQVSHQTPASCYFNTRSGSITVGANTVFGEDVKVLTGKHANIYEVDTQNVPLHYVPESGRDIVIGEGCYIGSSAIIIGPVNIGDFTVIGAGSVVTKSFPDRVFVAGNPAKLIRTF
jgi:acetyltransferase-like isoleucine patch superfamily enzyme